MLDRKRPGSGRHAPGPQGQQLRASLRRIRHDALAEYLALHAHYGDIVRLPSFPYPLYLIRHPDAVQHILRDRAQHYRKGTLFRSIASIQGQGLLTSEGPFWRQQRRLMQPALRQPQVNRFYGAVMEEIQSLACGWRNAAQTGEAVNITAWMHRLAFRVVGRVLFGLNPADLDPVAKRIQSIAAPLMHHIATGGHRSLAAWLPTPRTRRFQRALRAYHDIAQDIVDLRRQRMPSDGSAETDLLARLILAHDDAKNDLTSQQLRDEVITFIGAGVETSATALSWAWYLLACHPEVAQRLQAEVDGRLAGRLPSLDDLRHLSYSRMLLEETMRLYPPSAILPRQANVADAIQGYPVPKHAIVLMSQYVTHRHPDFWPDPERFDPDRFTPERTAAQHRFAYFPFGAGARVCIGKSLAMFDMQLTLVTMAQIYELRLIPERPVQPALGATLHPRGGLWMTVHKRH